MIIEFELLGSQCIHKGIFDTTGFWCRYESDMSLELEKGVPDGYKIYSHFSFAYYHTEKSIVDLVYSRLISVLRGANNVEIEGVGYFRKVNK